MRFWLALHLAAAAAGWEAPAGNGEEVCGNKGYNRSECVAIGCCHFDPLDGGLCWSDVGDGPCSDGGGPPAVQLSGVVGWADGAVLWHDPPRSGWELCHKVTTVFGIAVCVTSAAWSVSQERCNHVVHVFYQLMDNDADGNVDDSTVHAHMVSNGYLLVVPATESDAESTTQTYSLPPGVGQAQMTGVWEAVPNSCDTPTNRGASASDRSTWAAAVDTSDLSCDSQRDATTEEVLHLITMAAAFVYPELWGESYSSAAGAAIQAANGDCGWGYSYDWKDPSGNGCTGPYAYMYDDWTCDCTGHYAYDDWTCDEPCIVVEGIYWASVAYIGGLYTQQRAASIQSEWLLATPDASMAVEPPGVANAISLQAGSPDLYALVADTTSVGHAWLPAIMPDGRYSGTPTGMPMPSTACPANCKPASRRRRLLFASMPCPDGCEPI